MSIAAPPLPMQPAPGGMPAPQATPMQPQPQQQPAAYSQDFGEHTWKQWDKRIKAARSIRSKQITHVWKPLFEAFVGPMSLHKSAVQLEQRYAQYVSVLFPHLLGSEREVIVNVSRINLWENPDAKMQFAELLGDQATALMRNCGLDRDAAGRLGELERAYLNSCWSMGIMLLGFNAPKGLATALSDTLNADVEVDLDFAAAGRRELADAGMPWARSIDPRRFLGDTTFNDFTRGDWAAVEEFWTLPEVRAAFPHCADRIKASHRNASVWDEENQADQPDDGVCLIITAYHRPTAQIVVIPDPRCAYEDLLGVQPYDLGIEGLPFRLFGSQWIEGKPYPIPAFDRMHGSAQAEEDFAKTVFAAGNKIKTATIVNENVATNLKAELAKGNDSGVYGTDEIPQGVPLDSIIKTVEVGAIRREHLDLKEAASEATERNTGLSDLSLGIKEPGNQTVPEIQSRQAHIQARLAYSLAPARAFEASIAQGLIAVAYQKLDLLHGLTIPVGQQPTIRLISFDASRPMIGEILDYGFIVAVSDALNDADEAQAAMQLLQVLPNYGQLLAAEPQPKALKMSVLIEEILRKSRVRRAAEALYDIPPPQPQPQQMQPGQPPPDQSGATGPAPAGPTQDMSVPAQAAPDQGGPPMGGPVPAAPLPPQPAPIQQLYAALQQLPEGDPREADLIGQLAAALGQGGAQAA